MAVLNGLAHDMLAALLLSPGGNAFLAHLSVLSGELSPAATGNDGNWAGSKGNWAGNGSNDGTSESRSDNDLTGTLGDEDAVSGDRPEGLAFPLGVNLLEGVFLLRGWHEVSHGRSQDTTEKSNSLHFGLFSPPVDFGVQRTAGRKVHWRREEAKMKTVALFCHVQ